MGIATAHEIKPPAKTRIPIFRPTIYPTEISAGERSVPIPKIDRPTPAAPTISACHMAKPCWQTFIPPPIRLAIPIVFNPPAASVSLPCRASSPARRTSAVAIPSGYLSFATTINALRSGMVNNTPMTPPTVAIFATSI